MSFSARLVRSAASRASASSVYGSTIVRVHGGGASCSFIVSTGNNALRFQSSTAASASSGSGCPHAAGQLQQQQPKKDHSTLAADAAAAGCPVHAKTGGPSDEGEPKLTHVPALPFVGSLITSYSGIPPLDDPYNFWPTMRKKYGDFYTMGLPGLGNDDDPKKTVYVVQSPKEMMKVIRSEGSYPSGMAQVQWALGKWQREVAGFEILNHDDGGFMGVGENWKRTRQFMQTDLLHPTAARGYTNGIIEAAKLASKGAPASAADLNAFFERCAFDMFSTVMFGQILHVADPNTPTDPEDVEFVRSAKEGLGTGVKVARSLKDAVLVNMMGLETSDYKKMKENLDIAWKIGSDKIDRFVEKRERGELTELEKNSYLYRALERYEGGDSGVSLREAKEMSWIGIFAAVDTTSGKMGWNVLQAALNPDVQERLYQEIKAATEANGGELTVEALDKSNAPYLHAFVRETHRLTPVGPVTLRKRVASDDLSIHGVPIPRGSAVAFDGFSLVHDPAYVDEPRSFKPERWLDEAVEKRKGTPKEIIDHPFFKEPFSQGARKCPGSRVALNEVAVLLSQLLLDYKLSAPGVTLDDVAYAQETVIEPRMPTLQFEPRV